MRTIHVDHAGIRDVTVSLPNCWISYEEEFRMSLFSIEELGTTGEFSEIKIRQYSYLKILFSGMIIY